MTVVVMIWHRFSILIWAVMVVTVCSAAVLPATPSVAPPSSSAEMLNGAQHAKAIRDASGIVLFAVIDADADDGLDAVEYRWVATLLSATGAFGTHHMHMVIWLVRTLLGLWSIRGDLIMVLFPICTAYALTFFMKPAVRNARSIR